jgi:hypothetical protein
MKIATKVVLSQHVIALTEDFHRLMFRVEGA